MASVGASGRNACVLGRPHSAKVGPFHIFLILLCLLPPVIRGATCVSGRLCGHLWHRRAMAAQNEIGGFGARKARVPRLSYCRDMLLWHFCFGAVPSARPSPRILDVRV